MDFWVWVQTVGAVFAGNLLAAVFGYAFVVVYRRDREAGGKLRWDSLPMSVLLSWAAPLLFTAAVIYSLH